MVLWPIRAYYLNYIIISVRDLREKAKSLTDLPWKSRKITSTTLAAHVRQGKYKIEVVSTRKPCEIRFKKLKIKARFDVQIQNILNRFIQGQRESHDRYTI